MDLGAGGNGTCVGGKTGREGERGRMNTGKKRRNGSASGRD